jgi:hypothetical protein
LVGDGVGSGVRVGDGFVGSGVDVLVGLGFLVGDAEGLRVDPDDPDEPVDPEEPVLPELEIGPKNTLDGST